MTDYIEHKIFSLENISPQVVIEDYLERDDGNRQLIKDRLGPETKASVVIPAYNETWVITRCLRALNEQSYRSFEVVIVDNGSTDETVREIEDFKKQANYPLYVIKEPIAGVSIARKTGMDEVLRRLLERSGEFHHILAVTDADTIPQKEWLERTTKGFSHHQIGGLAGTHEASKEVEEKIYESTGFRNYFNIIPSFIEFIEERGVGKIKMSGPNSAFTTTSYALGGGIKQELDSNGKPKLSEVNNLGNRIREYGYEIVPMRCRVIKNRRRELFEIINNSCKDSYFPTDFSTNGRFNVVREDEIQLLDFACSNVPKEMWEYYRHKMIYKVLKNFIFQPFALNQITDKKLREIFTSEEIAFFSSIYSSQIDLPNNYYTRKFFREFLSRLEGILKL